MSGLLSDYATSYPYLMGNGMGSFSNAHDILGNWFYLAGNQAQMLRKFQRWDGDQWLSFFEP